MSFEVEVRSELQAIGDMLIEKNQAYGDSALNPLRVFSTADSTEQIKVRIDDKLSRLSRGAAAGEDVVKDLIGYLVMLRIAEKRAEGEELGLVCSPEEAKARIESARVERAGMMRPLYIPAPGQLVEIVDVCDSDSNPGHVKGERYTCEAAVASRMHAGWIIFSTPGRATCCRVKPV